MEKEIQSSIATGFLNKKHKSNKAYQPHLIVNDRSQANTMLHHIDRALQECDEFIFVVAFITESGLAMIKAQLHDLAQKGVRGRLITSTYLYFNQPKMFRELLKLKNVEVKITNLKGFHTKGYIFKKSEHYTLIVGSSNLTAFAFKENYEWNIKFTSHNQGEIVYHFVEQFDHLWEEGLVLTDEWIKEYAVQYAKYQSDHPIVEQVFEPTLNAAQQLTQITPNAMQEVAMQSLQQIRERGEKRAMVISATGTGKTYLSAFDVRQFRPDRFLFIAHREQILRKAMEDYKKVLGGHEDDYGLYTGTEKSPEAKYLFATIQTISRPTHLENFQPSTFDYILIDEVHRSGADTYKRLIDYFTPKFLLGMTATPERTDGINVFELFDYNIAYEIRLQDALEQNMLAPFCYFGVVDYEKDGLTIDDTSTLQDLVSASRVDYILEKINYYGYQGDQLRGLMFCSRVDEANELSQLLNQKGLRTVALSGSHSQQERDEAVAQLEQGLLDYILTVDIFNEGIDIPKLNQIVMLRQTESSIVFIQQLGRGLRKAPNKEYVTVIDFIGNYKNNYLIPIALSGDTSQNKDNIRKKLQDTHFLVGVSAINFEKIAKERIFQSIATTNLTGIATIREAYENLKNKIGRMPLLYDFIHYHSLDPIVLVDEHDNKNKHGMNNYYDVLVKMKESVPSLSEYQQSILTMVSKELLSGKRMHEIILLKTLIDSGPILEETYRAKLKELGYFVDTETIQSVERILDLSFFVKTDRQKYGNQPIVEKNDREYHLAPLFQKELQANEFFSRLIHDVLRTATARSVRYDKTKRLTLYEKYSRKDVCRLLNWDVDEKGTMYGYRLKHGTCPVFVTYHKDEDVAASQQYNDAFVDEQRLHWYSKSNRTLQSKEIQGLLKMHENDEEAHIFVKKDDGEGSHFYYLGPADVDLETVAEKKMMDDKGKELPVVTFDFELEHAVAPQLYDYLTHDF